MQFEQTAELNRHVDATIPLTWAVRWQSLRLALPLLACCSILFVEQIGFRLWLSDRSLISELPLLFICALTPIGLMMVVLEVQIRVAHWTKRTIKLEPKRISISPAKCDRIAWNQINVWRLEPIAHAPGLSKLTVEYFLGRKSKLRRAWSMVLRQPDQEHAFLSDLEYFRQIGPNTAQVIPFGAPEVPRVSGRRVRGMVAVALGFWCFIHGLPLLGVGLLPARSHADEPGSASSLTARESAKLQRTVVRHFSSAQQFRVFVLIVGGGMTALGAGLYFWGLSSPKRSAEAAVAEPPPAAIPLGPVSLP
jgi:hypothetical protein